MLKQNILRKVGIKKKKKNQHCLRPCVRTLEGNQRVWH